MTIQNLWDAAKAVLRGKFIAIQAYFKKQEKSQLINITIKKETHRYKEQTSGYLMWGQGRGEGQDKGRGLTGTSLCIK